MQLLKLAALFFLLPAIACKKTSVNPSAQSPVSPGTPHPAMTYINLSDKSVAFGQSLSLDLDKNGKTDLLFYTEQIAFDNNTKVKNVYHALSTAYCNLPVDTINESSPVYTKGMPISRKKLPGYEWYNVQSLDLVQKVFANNATYWEGPWNNRDHEYLPLQLLSGTKTFMGWIELGADTQQEKLIFYRAAICQEPEISVQAGM